METFGKRQGGGRRDTSRRSAPLIAVLTSTTRSHRATALVDISMTGARFRGDSLPEPGEELLVRIESIRAFGSVVWCRGQEFGMVFDPPLQAGEVELLVRQGRQAKGLSAEMKQVLDVWMGGSPR